MVAHREIVTVPFELWLTATVTMLSTPILTMVMYKATIKARFWEVVGQLFAAQALGHVIRYAAFRTLLTGNATWVRTNKFKSKTSYVTALLSTKEEALLGLAVAAFVIGAYMSFPYRGLSLMLLIGLTYVSLGYLAAPIMAVINVRSMKKETAFAEPLPEYESFGLLSELATENVQ